jgi:hypothetical protein
MINLDFAPKGAVPAKPAAPAPAGAPSAPAPRAGPSAAEMAKARAAAKRK